MGLVSRKTGNWMGGSQKGFVSSLALVAILVGMVASAVAIRQVTNLRSKALSGCGIISTADGPGCWCQDGGWQWHCGGQNCTGDQVAACDVLNTGGGSNDGGGGSSCEPGDTPSGNCDTCGGPNQGQCGVGESDTCNCNPDNSPCDAGYVPNGGSCVWGGVNIPLCPGGGSHMCTSSTTECASEGGNVDENYRCDAGGVCCSLVPPTPTNLPVPPTQPPGGGNDNSGTCSQSSPSASCRGEAVNSACGTGACVATGQDASGYSLCSCQVKTCGALNGQCIPNGEYCDNELGGTCSSGAFICCEDPNIQPTAYPTWPSAPETCEEAGFVSCGRANFVCRGGEMNEYSTGANLCCVAGCNPKPTLMPTKTPIPQPTNTPIPENAPTLTPSPTSAPPSPIPTVACGGLGQACCYDEREDTLSCKAGLIPSSGNRNNCSCVTKPATPTPTVEPTSTPVPVLPSNTPRPRIRWSCSNDGFCGSDPEGEFLSFAACNETCEPKDLRVCTVPGESCMGEVQLQSCSYYGAPGVRECKATSCNESLMCDGNVICGACYPWQPTLALPSPTLAAKISCGSMPGGQCVPESECVDMSGQGGYAYAGQEQFLCSEGEMCCNMEQIRKRNNEFLYTRYCNPDLLGKIYCLDLPDGTQAPQTCSYSESYEIYNWDGDPICKPNETCVNGVGCVAKVSEDLCTTSHTYYKDEENVCRYCMLAGLGPFLSDNKAMCDGTQNITHPPSPSPTPSITIAPTVSTVWTGGGGEIRNEYSTISCEELFELDKSCESIFGGIGGVVDSDRAFETSPNGHGAIDIYPNGGRNIPIVGLLDTPFTDAYISNECDFNTMANNGKGKGKCSGRCVYDGGVATCSNVTVKQCEGSNCVYYTHVDIKIYEGAESFNPISVTLYGEEGGGGGLRDHVHLTCRTGGVLHPCSCEGFVKQCSEGESAQLDDYEMLVSLMESGDCTEQGDANQDGKCDVYDLSLSTL